MTTINAHDLDILRSELRAEIIKAKGELSVRIMDVRSELFKNIRNILILLNAIAFAILLALLIDGSGKL